MITEIYEKNEFVLADLKNKKTILDSIIKLIHEEGRQVRFLKFFESILTSQQESLIVRAG